MIASYIYDEQDQLVSVSRGGQNYYYHFNGHGDVTKITDSTGSVVASYEYDAWGNITSSSGSFAGSQPFRYAGYLYDSETGLYYLINRYYDPSIGRFISRDPGFSSPPDSLGGNPYLYVRNNPVNRTDPDGFGSTGTLFGRVMNTAGSPIMGAAVRYGNIAISGGNYILPGNANVMGTNANGEFRFSVESGIYNMYYDAAGYQSQIQQLITVWPGKQTTVSIVILSDAVSYSAPPVTSSPNISASYTLGPFGATSGPITITSSATIEVRTAHPIPITVGADSIKIGGFEADAWGNIEAAPSAGGWTKWKIGSTPGIGPYCKLYGLYGISGSFKKAHIVSMHGQAEGDVGAENAEG